MFFFEKPKTKIGWHVQLVLSAILIALIYFDRVGYALAILSVYMWSKIKWS
jgi:hypothetical protein